MVKLVLKDGSFEAGEVGTQASNMVKTLVDGINENTRQNFTVKKNEEGELVFVEETVPNCGDWKRTLYSLPNNPFSLVNPATGHTNAKVHSTLRRMSTKTIKVGNEQTRISAKRVDKKVIYWNPTEARKLITASKSKEAKAMLEAKYHAFTQLEDAYPL